jgi:hypothetical protein
MPAFTQTQYYNEIKALAEEALKISKDEASRYFDDIYSAVHSLCDEHEYVIYTHKALTVLLHSDNDLAFQELGELPTESPWSHAAALAMAQDVYDTASEMESE